MNVSASNCAHATERYRVSTPCTLLSVSPSLAALHAARFQNLHPEASSTLLVRRKKKKKQLGPFQRVYRRACHMCGYTTDTPVPCLAKTTTTQSDVAPPTFPLKASPDSAITDDLPGKSGSPSKHETPSLQTSTPPTPTEHPLPPRSKRSQEKKAQTLREMLSRDRRREEIKRARKKDDTQGGLAAFLQGL
ncbi:hypothetical protein EDC04DRAFT_2623043 [Pisolithus marmoratus]|nr:hypothetical protein EDC04DRAFT_2623043 [Pisolithus marmoratus]